MVVDSTRLNNPSTIPIIAKVAKSFENRRMILLFQYGSAFTDNSLWSANIEMIMLNAGLEACPRKYPESALYGIAISIVKKRIGALMMLRIDNSLNFFSA